VFAKLLLYKHMHISCHKTINKHLNSFVYTHSCSLSLSLSLSLSNEKTFCFQDGTIIRGQNEISHPSNGRREIVNKVLERVLC
jgi:hypothetical protein